jgi:hypothetical protein
MPVDGMVDAVIVAKLLKCHVIEIGRFKFVMPGLVPGIHVLAVVKQERRGWPGIGERERRRPSAGYARP